METLESKFAKAKRIYDSNYYIDKEGNVYSNFNSAGRAKQSIRLIASNIRNGYPSVRINIDGTGIKHHTIHRIMAYVYLTPIEGMNQINHINGIKTDNRLENLEWSNASLNMIHAYRNGLMIAPANRKGFNGDLNVCSKSVKEYDSNGVFIKRHQSLRLTTRDGYNPISVSRNCRGLTKTYKNRIFRFETENEKPKYELSF